MNTHMIPRTCFLFLLAVAVLLPPLGAQDCPGFSIPETPPRSQRCNPGAELEYGLSTVADVRVLVISEGLDTVFRGDFSAAATFRFPAPEFGVYRVEATRTTDGCRAERQLVMGLDCGCADFLVSYSATSENCRPENNAITANVFPVTAGGGPYRFRWSNGDTTARTTNVAAGGSYLVTVTDLATGCRAINEVPFANAGAGAFRQTLSVVGDCDSDTIIVRAAPPFAGMRITWEQANGGPVTTGPEARLTQAGNVTVTVEDTINGICSFTSLVTLEDPAVSGARRLQLVATDTTGNCQPVNCLRLTGEHLPIIYGTVSMEWDAPGGPVVPDQNLLDGIQLCDPAPGRHEVRIGTACGEDTLRFFVPPTERVEDCGNLAGAVFLNTFENCSRDAGEIGVDRALLEFRNEATGAVARQLTDSTGNYALHLAAGSYTVTVINAPDGTRVEACTPLSGVVVSDGAQTTLDIPLSVIEFCPQLEVDFALLHIRRCFRNVFTVNYANRGTQDAGGVQLALTVDPLMDSLILLTPGFTLRTLADGRLGVDLGHLPPFSGGSLRFGYRLSCEAELGAAHCLDAELLPDLGCYPDKRWPGALLQVGEAGCDGETLTFSIANVGQSPTTNPVSYIIVEDGIMLRPDTSGRRGLAAGEELLIRIPADGKTYQLIVEQEPGAPAARRPSAVREACGGDPATASRGFANRIASGNGLSRRAALCRENIGSYDPNEKIGLPYGYGPEHDIEPGTRLRYDLHFQNTGTDTAFTVVIRDTLPAALDPATLKFGPASHDYRIRLEGTRVLVFTFRNILLPDSTRNLLASQGVVSYWVDHAADLGPGDRLANRAGIYFDFNEPVITDYARHRLALPNVLSSVADRPDPLAIRLSPNPARGEVRVTTPPGHPAVLRVYDATGRLRLRLPRGIGERRIDLGGWPAGAYLLRATTPEGRPLATKRFVVFQ